MWSELYCISSISVVFDRARNLTSFAVCNLCSYHWFVSDIFHRLICFHFGRSVICPSKNLKVPSNFVSLLANNSLGVKPKEHFAGSNAFLCFSSSSTRLFSAS